MDPLTSFFSGMDFPALTAAFSLISNEYIALLILAAIFAATAFLYREWDAAGFLALVVAFSLMISVGAKGLLAQPRPCEYLPSKIPCPEDSGLPSGHAIVAFSFAIALRHRKSFPIYLAIALLVAASRLYLGVHTFTQIAASLALSFVALAAAVLVYGRFYERG